MVRTAIGILVGSLIAATPTVAEEFSKPLFIGSWRLVDESCGKEPAILVVAAADSKRIIANGAEYRVTGLPGHPPHDRENHIIASPREFVIFGDEKADMVMSFPSSRPGITAQCHYKRITP